MPYSFHFEDRHVLVTVEGALPPQEERAAFRKLVTAPGFRSGMALVLDNRRRERGADRNHIKDMITEMAAALRRVRIPRMAIVAQRLDSFAIGALAAKLAEDHALPMEVEVFADLETAVAWATDPPTHPRD